MSNRRFADEPAANHASTAEVLLVLKRFDDALATAISHQGGAYGQVAPDRSAPPVRAGWSWTRSCLPTRPHPGAGRGTWSRSAASPCWGRPKPRVLLDSIDTSTPIRLRDRALIGLMVYSFAQVGAALGMTVLEHLAASGSRQRVELERKVLVLGAHPRIADVRQGCPVRFPVRQSSCPFSRACARFDGQIWHDRQTLVCRTLLALAASQRAAASNGHLHSFAVTGSGGKRT